MNLIELFGLKVKPRLTRGKKMWHPADNGCLHENIFSIRDKDVNLFLIKDESGFIAIDSGYKNSENVSAGLTQLGISPESVHTVFLTHLDIDHAGGVDTKSKCVFPRGTVYLGACEEKYLTGSLYRKRFLLWNCHLPIAIKDYKTMQDGQLFRFGEQRLEVVFAPGHTLGHTAYILNNRYLFSGDSIIANSSGGYCFFDFWNADSKINRSTLNKLRELCAQRGIERVITSHSGEVNVKDAFANIDQSPNWRSKGFVFDETAEENPYA